MRFSTVCLSIALILASGCANESSIDEKRIPVTLEQRGFYESARATAYSLDGVVSVSGELLLAPAYQLPAGFSAHIRMLGDNGRVLGEISSPLDSTHHREDLWIKATFGARMRIPDAEAERVDVTFDP